MTPRQFNLLCALLALIAAGLFLNAAGTLSAALPTAHASETGGAWTCYQTDRFDNLQDASSWGPLPKIAAGLDQVASDAARGTMLVVAAKAGAYPSSVCIKK